MQGKRRPGLIQLSSDHHTALVIARRCRTARAATFEAIWQELRKARDAHLLPHFELEETFLLPALDALRHGALSQRVRAEHQRMREALDRASPPLEQVRGFGDLLHDHVRFEERQIFDPLQQELPEDVLTALGQASDARDRAFDLGPLNRLR